MDQQSTDLFEKKKEDTLYSSLANHFHGWLQKKKH